MRKLMVLSIVILLGGFWGCTSTPDDSEFNHDALYPFAKSNSDNYIFDFLDHPPVGIEITVDGGMYRPPIIPERATYIPMETSKHINRTSKFCELLTTGDLHSIEVQLVFIGSYLSKQLENTTFFEDYHTNRVMKPMKMGGRSVISNECLIHRENDLNGFLAFFNLLRNEIAETGVVTIRRPSTDELDWYWTIIPYDISEPVFVLDTPDHSFLIDMVDSDMYYIDDLKYLNWHTVQ